MTTNVTRQPIVSVAIASGKPASSRPNWLSANSQLNTVAHDGRGYQRDIRTTPAMKLPAQPRPTTKRASAKLGTRLGGGVQQRSRRHQYGQDADGEARADAVEGDADRDLHQQKGGEEAAVGKAQRFRRQRQVANELGPITELEERKNCDRIAVAANIANRMVASLRAVPKSVRTPETPSFTMVRPELSNVSAIHHSRLITIVLLSPQRVPANCR